jgi:hypothetical protein
VASGSFFLNLVSFGKSNFIFLLRASPVAMRKGRFCSREGSDLFNARVSGQFGSISKKEGDKRSTT